MSDKQPTTAEVASQNAIADAFAAIHKAIREERVKSPMDEIRKIADDAVVELNALRKDYIERGLSFEAANTAARRDRPDLIDRIQAPLAKMTPERKAILQGGVDDEAEHKAFMARARKLAGEKGIALHLAMSRLKLGLN